MGFVLKPAKEATYLGFVGERKIGKLEKIKSNERNIFLSRDSCSCRANKTRKRLPTWASFNAIGLKFSVVISYQNRKF